MTAAAFTTEILERDNLLVGPWRSPKQMLHAQVYDSHASIHDDATAQKLGFQGGTIEGPTHFSQFAPSVRADLGPGLVRDRMPVRALSQPRLRGRGSPGQHRKAEAGPNHLRDRHDQARRHRDLARHRIGRRQWYGNRASPAARRTEAARRSRHSRRSQGRHEDRPANRENGFRPEHGRSLSVFAGREAEGDHRTFGVLFAGTQSLGPGHHSHGDAERAVSIPRPRGPAAGPRTGGRIVRGSGNPPAARPAIRRRELHSPNAKWSRSAAAAAPRACGCARPCSPPTTRRSQPCC